MAVKPKLGLSAWLAILVLGAVVPLLLFAGLALRGVLHTSRALADRGQVDTTRALALAVDGAVHEWRAALGTLASSVSLQQGRWAEFYEEASELATRYEGWVVVNPAAGEQQLNTLRPFGAPLPQTAASDMVQAVFREGKPVTDMTFGAVAQRYIISNSIPVFRDGKVIFCLSLNFGPERLTRLLQRQQLPETWVAALNDSQRRVVARSRDAEARVGKPVVEWFAAATRASESGVVTGPMIDGRLGQIAFERLKEVPWVVALAIPVAEFESAGPIWDFTSVGAILGLLAVGMAVYIGRQMTGPVKSLARASESLVRGETGYVGPPTGIREVQDLEQALVKASTAARAHAAEREQAAEALRHANEELERRVKERTAALASANEALHAANADLQDEIAQRRRAEEDVRILARFPAENPHPVLRLDSEGRILFANAASAAVLDQWGTKVGSPAPAPWPGAAGSALAGSAVATTELVCGDRIYAVFVAPVAEAGYVNLYMSEITERKRAEAAVENARRMLEEERNLLRSVMNGATNCHLVCLDRDFNFLHVNEAYAKTCGYTPEEMVGKNHFALYPHAENEAIFTRVRDTGVPEEFHDKPFVFPDQPERGTTYWDWMLTPMTADSGYVTGLVFSLVETTDRKRAEMALDTARAEALKEKNRLEAVMQALPVGMALVDGEGGTLRTNAEFEKIWGGPRPAARTVADYALYKAWWSDSGKPVQPEEWASAQALQRKRPVVGQLLQIERFDGARAFVLNSAAPVLDAEGEVVGSAVAIQDITDLRNAEEALRRERANLQAVFDVVNVGLVLMNGDGTIRRVNNAVSSWFGQDLSAPGSVQLGDLVGCIHALADPSGCGHTPHCATCPVRNAFESTLRTGEPRHSVEAEAVVVREGAPVHLWLEVNTEPLALDGGHGALLALHNITNRKQAEEALRQLNAELDQRVRERTADLAHAVALLQREVAERIAAEKATHVERQRLYDVLETLPVYVVLLSEDYHVPFANRFFRERFGESHGRRCFEYLFNRTEPCENCESYKVLKTGAPHHWEWTGPDRRNYDIYDFPFEDTDGSRFILEMGIDITEQKQAEAALQAAHRDLADRADQLRTLTTQLTLAEQRERRRLADVLHDELQQLLVATRLRAHMLGSTADPAVRQGAQEIVALMAEALGKTRSLTGELSPPTLQKGDLLPALEWITRWVAERHRLAVHLVTPPDPLLRMPEDTAVLLYQAVRECLLNAVKHAQASEATVTVTAAEPTLTITVADAGVGFDPAQLRVEGGSEGGVGLLGIRERLEWMGGRLEIASAPGQGSRFALVVPLGQSAPRPGPHPVAAPAEAESQAQAARRRRVLVVDDHALVRRGFATLLAGEPDLEVVGEADNGQRAVELARQTAPDVILMDINMPVMNGIDATRAIHAEFPAIRVIGLSVFDDPEQPEAMRQAGAVDYLRKSDSADALLAAIRGAPFDVAQGER